MCEGGERKDEGLRFGKEKENHARVQSLARNHFDEPGPVVLKTARYPTLPKSQAKAKPTYRAGKAAKRTTQGGCLGYRLAGSDKTQPRTSAMS